MYQPLTPDFEFKDERGILVQLIHSGYVQVNVITTNKGVIRGNHYHQYCREAFYIISGRVEVTLTAGGERQVVQFKSGDFFEILPMVLHEMFYPEDCVMIALYDLPVEREDGYKDIVTPTINQD